MSPLAKLFTPSEATTPVTRNSLARRSASAGSLPVTAISLRQSRNSHRRQIAPRPALVDLGGAISEAARLDRVADILHQALIIGDVVPGEEHRGQRLAGFHEVVQVGARI